MTSTQSTGSTTLTTGSSGQASSVQTGSGQATVVNQYVTQPAIERTVQTAATPSGGYVTQAELANQLNALSNTFSKTMYGTTYPAPATNYGGGGVFNTISLMSKIDNLSGTNLSNITVSGVSGLTAADLPSLSDWYLSAAGGTVGGAFSVSGYSTLATTTITGGLTVNGNTNITEGGQLTVGDKIIAPGEIMLGTTTTAAKLTIQSTNPAQTALLIYGTSTQSSPLLDIFSNTGQNLFRVTATGTLEVAGDTALAHASSTSFFSTIGRFTTGIIDTLTSTAATITNLIATTITGTNATFTNATTTNATSTNAFATNLTATNGTFTNATSTNFFATTASSTNLSTSLFNAGGGALVVSSTGKVGISTSTPWTKLSVVDTIGSAQFTLAYDATRYSQLYIDASGDLTLSATGGNVRLPDYNLLVCSGGACPSATINISGTGNLQIENRLIAGSIEQTCPSGYVWVPGLAKYGTLPGFCTMKYEAKNDGSSNAVSTAAGSPWATISQVNARAQCEALGAGYHLISEPEWMTIADEIAATPINDIDAAAGLQLATGHADNVPANALDAGTAATDPIVTGCNLRLPLSDASNAYAAGSCEQRGAGAGGSTDADKGYYGTGQQWSASGYSAGTANKSQLRTFILPNGAVLWDVAGNVADWTDAYIYSALASGAASTTSEMPDAGAWSASNWFQYTAITNYKNLGYIRPKVTTWSSTNGIGQVYLDVDASSDGTNYHAFLRGGFWSHTSFAGVFSLYLTGGPAYTDGRIGFRCSR